MIPVILRQPKFATAGRCSSFSLQGIGSRGWFGVLQQTWETKCWKTWEAPYAGDSGSCEDVCILGSLTRNLIMILVTDWNPGWGSIPQAITREGDEKLKSKLGKSKQESLVSKWDNMNWCKKTLFWIVTLCLLMKLHKKLWKGTTRYCRWPKDSFTIDFILKRSSNGSVRWPSLTVISASYKEAGEIVKLDQHLQAWIWAVFFRKYRPFRGTKCFHHARQCLHCDHVWCTVWYCMYTFM